MKNLLICSLVTAAGMLACSEVMGQYKAPSEYFPKNRPVPGAPGNRPPAAAPNAPAAPARPKFKDVTVNSQFYFLADTNRAFAWTKTSDTTARNTKTGAAQVIHAETPVQR